MSDELSKLKDEIERFIESSNFSKDNQKQTRCPGISDHYLIPQT